MSKNKIESSLTNGPSRRINKMASPITTSGGVVAIFLVSKNKFLYPKQKQTNK